MISNMLRVSLFAFLLFVLPFVATAAGLVPCGGEGEAMCDTAFAVQFANGLISFLIQMLGIIAVIVLVIAGFQLVLSAGNEQAWPAAKERITNIIIGIIIILAAWLIVDTIMKGLTGEGLRVWGVIDRSEVPEFIYYDPSNSGSGATGCPDCVQLQGIACKDSQSCSVHPDYAERLQGLSSAGIEVTEAWPPTRNHQATCHSNGTCTDVVFADRNFTPDRVQQFQVLASQNGFRAVYEPPAGVSCSGYTNCTPHSVTGSTGSHFSLYLE